MVTAFLRFQICELFSGESLEKSAEKERNLNFLFRFLWWTIQDSKSGVDLLIRLKVH